MASSSQLRSVSPSPSRAGARRWLERALVLLVMLSSVAWIFRPLLLEARGAGLGLGSLFFPSSGGALLLGGGVDLLGTLWTFDTVARMLEGQATPFNPDVFAPLGWDQGAAQAFAWLDAVLAYPLLRWLGNPAFYNLHVAVLLLAGQGACYILFRRVGASRWLAAVLAATCLLNAFVLRELHEGRSTQVYWLFHALFLALAWGVVDGGVGGERWQRTVVRGAGAGLLLACACYVYWFSAIALGLLALLAALLRLFMRREGRWRVIIGGLGLSLTAVAAAALPAWRLSGSVLAGRGVDWIPDLGVEAAWGLDLGPWWIPVRGQPDLVFDHIGELWSGVVGAGVPPLLLLLAAVGLLLPDRRRRLPWYLAALALLTLTWGPLVRIGDWTLVTAAGMGQWLFPPLVRCHHSERMAVAPLLGVALVVAASSGALMAQFRARGAVLALEGVLGLSLLLGGLVARPMDGPASLHLSRDGFYTEVVARWPGGMIHAPLWKSNEEYAFQMFHRQRLLGGPGIRGPLTRPPGHLAYCEANSLLRAFEELAAMDPPDMPVFRDADRQRLVQDGFSVVVVHTQRSAAAPERYRDLLGTEVWQRGLLAAIPLGPSAAIRSPGP